jgi:DNA polymerase III subunit gamma/tau
MSWNRTYRPAKVAELHLSDVRNQLQALLKSGRIPPVMLFAGPKGTGKTSASRILAAVVNDPANDLVVSSWLTETKSSKKASILSDVNTTDPFVARILAGTSLSIREMDAASNRGIDDIRALKESVFLPPSEGKMAVYILDEAHMLTTEAFNALLKLLEEPPAHVIFILATTELHKIPATVASRCHTVHFQKATHEEIGLSLTRVLELEKITFEDEALDIIVRHADGSFRDALKLAEAAVSAGQGVITSEAVLSLIRGSQQTQAALLIAAIVAKNEANVVALFSELRNQGANESFFHRSLLDYLHQQLLLHYQSEAGAPAPDYSVAILHFLLTEFSSSDLSQPSPLPFLLIELKSLELIFRAQKKQGKPPAPKPDSTTRPVANPNLLAKTPIEQPNPGKIGDGAKLCSRWHEFVEFVREKNSTLAALLLSAQPLVGARGEVTIQVYYKFHQEQLSQPKIRSLLNELIFSIAGGYLEFRVVLAQHEQPQHQQQEAEFNLPTEPAFAELVSDNLL